MDYRIDIFKAVRHDIKDAKQKLQKLSEYEDNNYFLDDLIHSLNHAEIIIKRAENWLHDDCRRRPSFDLKGG